MSAPMLVLALVFACTDKAGSDDTGTPGTTGDGGDGGTTTPSALVFSQATIPTTGVVTWTVAEGTTQATVSYGVDGDTTWTAAATISDGQARAVLRGMRPGLAHVLTATEDGAVVDTTTVTAGASPGSLPTADIVVDEPDSHQLFMVSSVLATPSTAVIYNAHGEIVWWHEPIFEEHVITRAWPAWDGSGVHYISRPNPGSGGQIKETWLVQVDWTGDSVQTVALEDVHHDFLELDDGTIAYLSEDTVEVSDQPYVGDRLMERSPDGVTTQVWSVWDTYSPAEDTPDDVTGTSWSHANAIDYDAETRTYYVSLRNFNAIVAIDRDSGEKTWQLGGEKSDYLPMLADEFNWQHQFEWQASGNLLVFDNGNTDRFYSRATEYSFDDESGRVSVAWQHISDPPTFCYGPGDVHRLANGNTIVTWGSSGRIQEVTPDGTVVWDNLFGVGGAFGYTTWVEDLNAL